MEPRKEREFFMLVLNVFLFFLLPILVLFLTRKRTVRQMVLWTALVQVVVLAARIVVYPVAWCLSWGFSLSEAMSYENLSAWYSGSGIQLIFLAIASIVFTALILLCAAGIRTKRAAK